MRVVALLTMRIAELSALRDSLYLDRVRIADLD
jgi:hypothetical protein